ncbi:MAG: alpha/beta hydrolase [Candidatus Nanopelagicales bacterium]
MAALAAALLTLVGGCATTGDTRAAPSSAGSEDPAARVVTADYRPGLSATLRLPVATGPATLVVLVPGGGWQTADPAGLVPLAQTLTSAGAATATITYGTASTGAVFPEPADDVACAVRWAAATATRRGVAPEQVVLLGHSAGGHLAALVTLAGNEFGADCPDPAVDIDALVGLAGVYRVGAAAEVAVSLFGVAPGEDPERWQRGDPTWWADHGGPWPGLRVLLLHGDADTLVPVTQTSMLGDALDRRGVDVTVRIVPEATHQSLYEQAVAAPLVLGWLGLEDPAAQSQATGTVAPAGWKPVAAGSAGSASSR